MYIIGRNDFDFVKIKYTDTLYNGQKIWNEIRSLEYNTPLNQATIINDYDIAKELLEEIKNNVENIKFTNNSIIGEILDEKYSFSKDIYIKELKLFKLMPAEIS